MVSRLSTDEVNVDLFDELKRVKRMNEELQTEVFKLREEVNSKNLLNEKLKHDISIYREALAFYAESKNYENLSDTDLSSWIHYDKGSRARLILEELYDPSKEMTRQHNEAETEKK